MGSGWKQLFGLEAFSLRSTQSLPTLLLSCHSQSSQVNSSSSNPTSKDFRAFHAFVFKEKLEQHVLAWTFYSYFFRYSASICLPIPSFLGNSLVLALWSSSFSIFSTYNIMSLWIENSLKCSSFLVTFLPLSYALWKIDLVNFLCSLNILFL